MSADLRVPLAKALCVRLPGLDLLPSTSVAICTWLARLDDAIADIDGGRSVVVATTAAFFPTLMTLDEARHAAADAKIDAVAIDLAPLLATVRKQLAELN
jgi:hypothetical protein